jgi:hypothetical protein
MKIGTMRPDVVFTVIFRKDGELLAAPTVLGEFGRAWQHPQEMSMEAHLSMTPSIEYSVPETPYRFVVMPRRVVPASPDGRYLAISKTETVTKTAWHFQ